MAHIEPFLWFLRRSPRGHARILSAAALLLLGLATSGIVSAQDKRVGGPTPAPQGAAVYFIDVKDGATIPAKTIIHFGLRNMGVAPAGMAKENSGHHHLLIDTDLPPLDQPIPNDFNHLHFGAGQTEAELTLTPGEHTLQLLLGDKDHIPHNPPIVSDRIRVIVVAADQAAAAESAAPRRKPAPADAKVYFVYPTNGAVITPTVVIRFGLSNMGVAPAGVDKPNTGHHHLLIDAGLPPLDQPIPNDFNHLHFGNGQTEAQITLTPGVHTLQLLLGDENHIPHDPPVVSAQIKVRVVIRPPKRKTHPRR